MADAIFPKAKERADLALGQNLVSGDVRAMLVKSTYAYDVADVFVADLGAVDNGRTAALANKSNTDGVFDADNTTLNATAADASNAIVLFHHTGNDATARLIAYLDSFVGLPFTPEAAQACPITWSDGANKIFKL